VDHARRLIRELRQLMPSEPTSPIFWLAPPPYGSDQQLEAKYAGAALRRAEWLPDLRAAVESEGAIWVPVDDLLFERWAELSPDGVHVSRAASRLVAKRIADILQKHDSSP
ncbi:hypothetical protein RZS08_15235, partial [Arthrospira platensis SPKY1]|nr:hypothetical protein [Arthrospira platensis SPKY1]